MTGAGHAMDRRLLLQAGLAATALASMPAVVRNAAVGGAPGGLPTLADWEAVLGDVVELVGDGVRFTAQVVDVRDITPAADPAATGSAYSVLFDLPEVPRAGYHSVVVRSDDVPTATIVINPVNGDSSWESIVDTRHPKQ